MTTETWTDITYDSIVVTQQTTWDHGTTTWDRGTTTWDATTTTGAGATWTDVEES